VAWFKKVRCTFLCNDAVPEIQVLFATGFLLVAAGATHFRFKTHFGLAREKSALHLSS
jgi:hypothetical protein